MKLYVHFEDVNTKWTKRLTLAPTETTLHVALEQFCALFAAKFARPLALEKLQLQTETNQNECTRRLITADKYDQTLQQLGIHPKDNSASDKATCDVELVITPRPTKPSTPSTHAKTTGNAAITNKKPTAHHSLSSSVSAMDVQLRSVLDLALSHLKARRHRAARETYETLILSIDPRHPEALLGLGEIYFSIGKFAVAAAKYFGVSWRTHHREPQNKAYALMAFTSALKLAECHLKTRKYHDALSTLDELQQFLRKHSKYRSFFSDVIDKERMEAQMDYLRACALYELNLPAEQETAISLLMHLLPDLQDPRVNLDALQLYARIAQDRGRANEALSMLLRVLVGKSTDYSVRKQLVSLLSGKNGIERLLYSVPTTTPSAAAAYAFTATILKDFSALEASAKCFEHAQALASANAAYALNRAHVLEVSNQYRPAYESLVAFFRASKDLKVLDALSVGVFVNELEADPWGVTQDEVQASLDSWSLVWQTSNGEGYAAIHRDGAIHQPPYSVKTLPSRQMTEQELDLLACCFTIVKILFIIGRLHALPRLIAMLEPLRRGRQLHTTSIRNEQAYYMCIAQLLSVQPVLNVPQFDMDVPFPGSQARDDVVYVCGDSHTLATAWRRIQVHGKEVQLRPALVTGLKHWHLRKASEFYPKANFWHVVASLPRRSRVVFLFGEIDCREGIVRAVELCKYESIQEGMEHTIRIFMDTLAEVVDKYEIEAFIHPVVPVLNETRSLVIQYNQIFQTLVRKSSRCKWLDFFDDLLEGSPSSLRRCYALDGTHLHPSYLTLLERELRRLLYSTDERCE